MPLRALLLAILVLLPVAGAEAVDLQVVGASLGWHRGVAGVQWDEEGAIGMRYWFNQTEGDEAAFLVTLCATTDAHLVYYCERHPLSP